MTLLALAWAVSGCAGFRGGWESVAYVGDVPPALEGGKTPPDARRRNEITLPGMTLGVALNNQLRTYDTQVYLFVLPLSVDPRNVQTRPVEPGRTRVTLSISDLTTALTFRPQRARLTIGSQVAQGVAGFQFGMWDAQGRPVSSGGRWEHRATGEESVLAPRGTPYILNIDFPLPVPSPEAANISLDLSEALTSPQLPAVPTIRFAPVRWKEGYT